MKNISRLDSGNTKAKEPLPGHCTRVASYPHTGIFHIHHKCHHFEKRNLLKRFCFYNYINTFAVKHVTYSHTEEALY